MLAKFKCVVTLIGVGYKANTDVEGRKLYLSLGLSHSIILSIPPFIKVFCLKPTLICCTGTNLNHVTQFAAIIKACKPPEVYKGKGIRYRHEIVLQKQGKKK